MSGDVGIFWVDQGQLIMAAVPVADEIDYGRFVNGPYDHERYWETVQCTHVHLWEVEYYQMPWERMLLNKAEHCFDVYLDKVLCTNPIKWAILEQFYLPQKHTTFRTDLHYTTDPDELDRWFSQSHTSNAAPPHKCLG